MTCYTFIDVWENSSGLNVANEMAGPMIVGLGLDPSLPSVVLPIVAEIFIELPDTALDFSEDVGAATLAGCT